MSECFCTKTYQCLACEDKATGYVKPKRATSTIRKVAECGTRAGYNKHLRLGETTCDKCKAAHTQAIIKWQRKSA